MFPPSIPCASEARSKGYGSVGQRCRQKGPPLLKHPHTYIDTYMPIYVCNFMCKYMYKYVHACIYTYTYTYTLFYILYMYIYIGCICIHTHVCMCLRRPASRSTSQHTAYEFLTNVEPCISHDYKPCHDRPVILNKPPEPAIRILI